MAVEARHTNLVPSLQSLKPRFSQMNPQLLFSAACSENRFLSHQILHSHQTLEKYSINNDFSSAPRKRTTGSELNHDIAFQIKRQKCEMDSLIPPNSEMIRLELEEKKRRQTRLVILEIKEIITKKLREKDEEVDRVGKLNWVLEERVRNLCRENQILKDLAYKNELTLHSLRSNIEQALAQVPHHSPSGTLFPADDAGSSCGSSSSEDAVGGGAFEISSGEWGRKKCRNCWEKETRVLLLPCRHLCVCSSCGSNLHTCPVCDSAIDTCLLVNFS